MYTSIIMINHNGGTFLVEALQTCRADLETVWKIRTDFELVVVDNNSTDNSLEVIKRELSNSNFKWILVQEHTLGVNAARNAGIEKSTGDFLIFVDSDLRFESGWLAAYLEAAEVYKDIEVFAGRIEVGTVEGVVPDWLDIGGPWKRSAIVVQVNYGEEIAIFPLKSGSGRGPAGANMGFRTSIFKKVGVFDAKFGLRPGSLLAGAEAEFFDRLSRLGTSFAWVPKAVVYHPLKKNQISRRYFLTRLYGIGRVSARMALKKGVVAKRLFGMTLYRIPEIGSAFIAWCLASIKREKKESFYHLGQIAVFLGYLHEDFLHWSSNRRKTS